MSTGGQAAPGGGQLDAAPADAASSEAFSVGIAARPHAVLGAAVLQRGVARLAFKQQRRIATRFEKRASNYLAMLTLAAILLWL